MASTEIEIRFNNDTATQFGGFPLIASYLHEIELNSRFARHIKMSRGPLAFTAPELSRFLVDAKLLGADRLMHLDRFRLDPMLTSVAGIDGLPSGKTMGVYLKSFLPNHLGGLDRLNSTVLRSEWNQVFPGKEPTDVILDFDSTTMTVYGKQEEADRGRSFRKKDKPGYQPKFAFVGGLGLMVHQRLEPQSHNLDKDFLTFFKEARARLPSESRIWAVRGDGALYSHQLIRRFEQDQLVYAITAARTQDLQAVVRQISEDQWEEGVDEKGRPYSIARIRYCPKTWKDQKRTFVVSRRLRGDRKQGRLFPGDKYKYFVYITNYRGPLLSQYQFCVERCSLESFVKESKAGFEYHHLPCAEAHANRAYLGHIQLAFNLAIFFKRRFAPRGVNRWTFQTFRERLLCVCGNLRRRKKRWCLSLPSWWPYQTVFRRLMKRCELGLLI